MFGDFITSLGSCYFVHFVNERTSVVSFACALKGARVIIFSTLLTRKLPVLLSCLNEISGDCEKILPVWF